MSIFLINNKIGGKLYKIKLKMYFIKNLNFYRKINILKKINFFVLNKRRILYNLIFKFNFVYKK